MGKWTSASVAGWAVLALLPMISAAEADALRRLHVETAHTAPETGGAFESIIEEFYRALLRPEDQAVDGGAHGGRHAMPMAECVGVGGRVYAYEPVPAICAWLRDLTANYPQIEVVEAALFSEAGSVQFHNLPDTPWLSSVTARDLDVVRAGAAIERLTVRSTTLDMLQDRPIRFMKLDLESGEYHALKGGLKLLEAQRPIVIAEWGGCWAGRSVGYGAEDYFGLLRTVQYDTADLFGRPFGVDGWALPETERPLYVAHFPRERPDVPPALERATRAVLAGG